MVDSEEEFGFCGTRCQMYQVCAGMNGEDGGSRTIHNIQLVAVRHFFSILYKFKIANIYIIFW